jgi:hypothetical protein
MFPSTKYSMRCAHTCLNVDGSDILPSLLKKGNHIIDGHVDVVSELFSIKLNGSALIIRIPDGTAETNALLQLELNRVLQLFNLGDDFLTLIHGDGELAHLNKHISEQLVDLLDDDVRSEEHVILLGPLANLGLFLIEGLETINIDEVDACLLSLVVMHDASQYAHLHQRSRTFNVG